MLRYFLFVLLMLLPACAHWEATPTPITSDTENVDISSVIPVNTEPRWLETTIDGVKMGIMTPSGWFAEAMDGLMIAEHISPVEGGPPAAGILVYIFAPPLDEFTLPGEGADNFALLVLRQVIQMPTHVGTDVSVSEPVAFRWGDHDAAYYLLTGADGTRTMVIGLAVPELERLVVANVSVPGQRESALREALPRVLNRLEVNGVVFDGSGLNVLPDPLPFPEYIDTTLPD